VREEPSRNSHIIVEDGVEVPIAMEQPLRVRNPKIFKVQQAVGQVLVHELDEPFFDSLSISIWMMLWISLVHEFIICFSPDAGVWPTL